MTEVRTLRVKSRLSRLISRPGGISVRQAIEQAENALEACRESGISVIDGILSEMETGYALVASPPDSAAREQLYLLASQIIDVSICMRDSGIDKASRALCDLVDICDEIGAWDLQCVEIHIRVLKLLRHSGRELTPAKRERMIQGLSMITARRFGAATARPAANG